MFEERTGSLSNLIPDWWTYAAVGLVVCGIIFGLILYGRKWIQRQKEIQLQKRQADQRQAFNELALEFRTALTLILLPTEHMMMETQELKNKRRLTTIEKNVYRLLELLNLQVESLNLNTSVLKDRNLSADLARDSIGSRVEKNDWSPLEQPCILLVEDNLELADSIVGGFSGKYSVLRATNGLEGWTQATDLIPDLIISDIDMPGLDGFGLCRKLKEDRRTQHIPVVLLTETTSVENRIKGLAQGADDYIIKPYNLFEFQLRIQNLMDNQRRLRDWLRN